MKNGALRVYQSLCESHSVAFSFRGMEVPIEGLKELVDETKKCLIDAKKNKQKHFLLIQKANIQARKQAMIDESKTIIQCCSRSGWIGWAYPHTLLAMRSLLHPFKQE
ncbi:hypothetical protein ACMWP2_01660 [Helicobacter pylori]|uniref:hypothetical protein n=1 Tax=Helicobacter pylori TaxID=210 RepID=UPI003AEAE856